MLGTVCQKLKGTWAGGVHSVVVVGNEQVNVIEVKDTRGLIAATAHDCVTKVNYLMKKVINLLKGVFRWSDIKDSKFRLVKHSKMVEGRKPPHLGNLVKA